MAEIREGIRNLLAVPALYDLFQGLVGAYAWRKRALQRFVVPQLRHGASILDIGCGTAEIVAYLPEHVRYFGFDRNPAYIEKARARFGRADVTFRCEEFTGDVAQDSGKYDVVLALGLLHHLGDEEATLLMQTAKRALLPGGMLLTLDPLLTPQQSSAARWLVTHDRGKNVRSEGEYLRLARAVFDSVETHVDDDPMYLPYTGIVLICRPHTAEPEAQHNAGGATA